MFLDRIRNEGVRGTTNVGEISKKVQESRLKWYGHVVPGKMRRRPKLRWLDSNTIRNDLSKMEFSGEEAQDRVQ